MDIASLQTVVAIPSKTSDLIEQKVAELVQRCTDKCMVVARVDEINDEIKRLIAEKERRLPEKCSTDTRVHEIEDELEILIAKKEDLVSKKTRQIVFHEDQAEEKMMERRMGPEDAEDEIDGPMGPTLWWRNQRAEWKRNKELAAQAKASLAYALMAKGSVGTQFQQMIRRKPIQHALTDAGTKRKQTRCHSTSSKEALGECKRFRRQHTRDELEDNIEECD